MIELKTPCTSEDIEKLKCGDVVKISGVYIQEGTKLIKEWSLH